MTRPFNVLTSPKILKLFITSLLLSRFKYNMRNINLCSIKVDIKHHKSKSIFNQRYKIEADSVISLSESQFLMPGLIDTHIHAPQFPNAGLALDLTLLDWLQRYTFPTEEKMSDLARAEEVYARCVRSTLDSGTTTASYFGTIHLEACILLAKICKSLGQRALIGKVNMDRNSPPTYW